MLASSIGRSSAWRVSRVVAFRSFSSTTTVQEQYDVVVVGTCDREIAVIACASHDCVLIMHGISKQVEALEDTWLRSKQVNWV